MDVKHKIKAYGCLGCHIRCGAVYKVEKYNIERCIRPQYEALGAFGSMLLNGDSDVTVTCNHLCNEYGYDVLSFGGTIAWLMECYEKGIFTKEELYKALWNESAVGFENTVYQHIKTLRDKLKGADPEFIKTVWGRGYMLI